ncbi:MAG: hypothetical protein ACFHWX_21950 [Bacteroidota bacterium]
MRFPSLFRLPSSQRFHIQPRYYDPVKEEIKERTERIKREIESGERSDYFPGRISFDRKNRTTPNASFLQLVIAAILGSLLIGWFYYGNDVFYVLWLTVPIYIYFRFVRKYFQRH